MPKTTSRNWETFNIEDLDRRRREAEEKKLFPAAFRSASGTRKPKKQVKQSKKHRRTKTPDQPQVLSSKSRPPGSIPVSRLFAIRKATAPSSVSLAKELENDVQRFILAAAKSEGVDLKSVQALIPNSIANRIRSEIKRRLAHPRKS